jgi:hypothetical protein
MNLERSLRANLSGMEEAPTGPLQSPHPLDSWNVEERFLDCLRVASCLRAAGGGSGQLVPKPKFRALMDAKKKKKKRAGTLGHDRCGGRSGDVDGDQERRVTLRRRVSPAVVGLSPTCRSDWPSSGTPCVSVVVWRSENIRRHYDYKLDWHLAQRINPVLLFGMFIGQEQKGTL